MSSIKQDLFNLPNMLTMGRILVIPLGCVLLAAATPMSCFWAAILFAMAAATDFADGMIARARGLVTLTGKFLDPLADKLIVMAMLIVLVDLGWVAAWIVVLVLGRELTITGLRAIAAGEGLVVAASDLGKYKTAFQLTGLIFLMLHFRYPIDLWFYSGWANFHVVGFVLFGISVGFSLLSGMGYIVNFYKALGVR